ncbi:hypothetical protein D8M27_06770 [Corynebacterium pseudodiphtheriticum]|nr:hypothetical protein D8M37_07455 [Corynebacterium pseudodiphtheriticum]RUP94784.1 hypothetical protein D8M27_06770 [Corynebacterium pseudodiphtheriticum]RUP98955.1 hypothetical protein D8M32_06770 [Corynebacterium pseudodiphtheriticum]RUQ47444.1 hypothetical protein D8M30_07455 [Corynebacterium pseudodiphtheriticum]
MLIAELAPWRQENHKLRDTNELLKTDSDFSHRHQTQNLRYDPNRGCGRNTPRLRPHPHLCTKRIPFLFRKPGNH